MFHCYYPSLHIVCLVITCFHASFHIICLVKTCFLHHSRRPRAFKLITAPTSYAMPAFEIHDQYPSPCSAGLAPSELPDNPEFEIGSLISDSDCEEYRDILNELEPEKVTRQLADSSKAVQILTRGKWTK